MTSAEARRRASSSLSLFAAAATMTALSHRPRPSRRPQPTSRIDSSSTTEPPTTTSTTNHADNHCRPAPPTSPTTTPRRRSLRTTGRPSSRSLARRRVALYAAPDLSRIGEYCVPQATAPPARDSARRLPSHRGQHVEGQQPFDVVEIVQASVGEHGPAAHRRARSCSSSPRRPRRPPARRRCRQRRRRALTEHHQDQGSLHAGRLGRPNAAVAGGSCRGSRARAMSAGCSPRALAVVLRRARSSTSSLARHAAG